MASTTVTVDRLPKGTKLFVKFEYSRPFQARLWVAAWLIKVAARVLQVELFMDGHDG